VDEATVGHVYNVYNTAMKSNREATVGHVYNTAMKSKASAVIERSVLSTAQGAEFPEGRVQRGHV
jgi:hypothetical protein